MVQTVNDQEKPMSESLHVVRGNRGQELSIIGNNNSVMEYAYGLAYLVTLLAGVALVLAVLVLVGLYVYTMLAWPIMILLSLATFGLSLTLMFQWTMWAMKLLLQAYGANNQPRGEDGRYIPVYTNGVADEPIFARFTAALRKKRDRRR